MFLCFVCLRPVSSVTNGFILRLLKRSLKNRSYLPRSIERGRDWIIGFLVVLKEVETESLVTS